MALLFNNLHRIAVDAQTALTEARGRYADLSALRLDGTSGAAAFVNPGMPVFTATMSVTDEVIAAAYAAGCNAVSVSYDLDGGALSNYTTTVDTTAGAFVPATGVFRAPARGIYHAGFGANWFAQNTQPAGFITLMKRVAGAGASNACCLYQNNGAVGTEALSVGRTMLLTLEAGDEMYLKATNATLLLDESPPYFEAHMLTALPPPPL